MDVVEVQARRLATTTKYNYRSLGSKQKVCRRQRTRHEQGRTKSGEEQREMRKQVIILDPAFDRAQQPRKFVAGVLVTALSPNPRELRRHAPAGMFRRAIPGGVEQPVTAGGTEGSVSTISYR